MKIPWSRSAKPYEHPGGPLGLRPAGLGRGKHRPPLKAVRPLRNRSAKPYGYPEGPWACDPLRHAAICCVTPLRHTCRNPIHGTVRMTPHAARRRFERGAAVGGWRGRYSRGSATTSQRQAAGPRARPSSSHGGTSSSPLVFAGCRRAKRGGSDGADAHGDDPAQRARPRGVHATHKAGRTAHGDHSAAGVDVRP